MQYVPGQTPAPGWNTFGPVFQPATPSPALHVALQPKGHVPQRLDCESHEQCYIITLCIYTYALCTYTSQYTMNTWTVCQYTQCCQRNAHVVDCKAQNQTRQRAVFHQHPSFTAVSTSVPRATDQQHLRSLRTVAVVLLVLLVTYLVLYGVLRWKLPADSPGRKRADRWLWCWSSLYDGQACCFYNVIFSPFVLTIHAARLKKK